MYMITTIGMVTNIRLVRGDSLCINISLTDEDGTFAPAEGDTLVFESDVLTKSISTETLQLVMDPDDTSGIKRGTYPYSIILTQTDGTVDTVVRGKFTLV